MNLTNTEIAFAYKSDKELRRTYLFFKLVSYSGLVNIMNKVVLSAMKLGLPVSGLLKKTAFRQFCGGESISQCADVISMLLENKVHTILDYSVEATKEEAVFEATCQEIIRILESANDQAGIKYTGIKITGLVYFNILKKLNSNLDLSPSERTAFEAFKSRVYKIAERAQQLEVPFFIDAEHSWIQKPIDSLAYELMQSYNKEKVLVYNTIQFYLKNSNQKLEEAYRQSKDGGYKLGIKLVRGAYMDQERERAARKKLESPVFDTKSDTDNAYNEAIRFAIRNAHDMSVSIATHNDESVLLAADLMQAGNLDKAHSGIHFAQLYGMSDHITFNLAAAGYNVCKYLPYGPVKSVVPYLIRRADENKSVPTQLVRDYALLKKELIRRKILRN